METRCNQFHLKSLKGFATFRAVFALYCSHRRGKKSPCLSLAGFSHGCFAGRDVRCHVIQRYARTKVETGYFGTSNRRDTNNPPWQQTKVKTESNSCKYPKKCIRTTSCPLHAIEWKHVHIANVSNVVPIFSFGGKPPWECSCVGLLLHHDFPCLCVGV